jgi:hypothetical protein
MSKKGKIVYAKITVHLTEKMPDGAIIESEMDLDFCPLGYHFLPNHKVSFEVDHGSFKSTMTRYNLKRYEKGTYKKGKK